VGGTALRDDKNASPAKRQIENNGIARNISLARKRIQLIQSMITRIFKDKNAVKNASSPTPIAYLS
jgi:hypothetical protein